MSVERPLQWLVEAITGPEPGEADVESWLTRGPRQTARERLEIYRSGYHARLVECLEDDYPALAALLGPARFESLCRRYVDHHPSRSPSLNAYGRHMAAFGRDVDLPLFHCEVARLEWAIVEVIHAALPPPFDLAQLGAVPEAEQGDVRLVASESVRLLRFDHPVNAFYGAWRTGTAVPDVPRPAATAVAVHRRGIQLLRTDVPVMLAPVLEALLSGAPLSEGLHGAEDPASPDLAARIPGALAEWVASGYFAGFTR